MRRSHSGREERQPLLLTRVREGVSVRAQRAYAKRVLCSARKKKLGENVAALDGGWSSMQHKENGQRAMADYEEGQYVTHLRLPAKEEEAQGVAETALKGNRFAILAAESEQVFSRRA